MQDLTRLVERTAEETSFTGAISIVDHGQVEYAGAFGERDRSNHLPNTVDTRFGIASGTKLITALGIGALIDQDKLTVGTEVGEIRADFHTFIDPSATILQLLTHTSGAYDYYDEEEVEDFDDFFVDIPWYRLTTPTDYLPLFEGRTMKSAAGERFSYSNGGYILLGVLIETITGQRYRDFIQQYVLDPAHMDDSGFFAFNDLPENVAVGYVADGSQSNIYNLPMRGASDGGLFATLDDITRLWTSLFRSEIVSVSFAQEMLKPHVTFDDTARESGYGYGLYWSSTERGNRMFYIVGSDAGVGFDSAHFPEQEMTVTILSNTTDGEEQMRGSLYAALDM